MFKLSALSTPFFKFLFLGFTNLFALIFKTYSLGALSASISAPVLFWIISKLVEIELLPNSLNINNIEIYIVFIITVLIWTKHIPNIKRIFKGTESKI